MMKVDVND